MKCRHVLKYLLPLLLCACNQPGYDGYFLNVTDYKIKGDYEISPAGIKVYKNGNDVNLNDIDLKVLELEQCLEVSIHRDWFSVYIPSDWYWSNPVCGDNPQQLIPSTVDYRLCEAKGLEIKEECRYLKYTTEECPCVCNVRSTIQNNNVVITTPNLKLFKMPLTRMVIYPEYLFGSRWEHCAWE